jgi:hypothetical protein
MKWTLSANHDQIPTKKNIKKKKKSQGKTFPQYLEKCREILTILDKYQQSQLISTILINISMQPSLDSKVSILKISTEK